MRKFAVEAKGLNKKGELEKFSRIMTVRDEALERTNDPKLFIDEIEHLNHFSLGKRDLEVQITLRGKDIKLPGFSISDPMVAYTVEIVSNILVQLTAALK